MTFEPCAPIREVGQLARTLRSRSTKSREQNYISSRDNRAEMGTGSGVSGRNVTSLGSVTLSGSREAPTGQSLASAVGSAEVCQLLYFILFLKEIIEPMSFTVTKCGHFFLQLV